MEQKLKWEDLIEGECYAAMYVNERYVFIKKGNCESIPYILGDKYYSGGNLSIKTNSSFPHCLIGTPQEKANMLASIKARRFTKGVIHEEYSIF